MTKNKEWRSIDEFLVDDFGQDLMDRYGQLGVMLSEVLDFAIDLDREELVKDGKFHVKRVSAAALQLLEIRSKWANDVRNDAELAAKWAVVA